MGEKGIDMLNFLDVYERAIKGPSMSEKDFDMKVFIPTLNKVVKAYDETMTKLSANCF